MIFIQPPHLHLHLLLFLFLLLSTAADDDDDDVYNNNNNDGFCFIFKDSEVMGAGEIKPNGHILDTKQQTQIPQTNFYSLPFRFKNSTSGNAFSFSTSFVFVPHGITFSIAPSIINTSNHVLAIQLHTNHVALHINTFVSVFATTPGYYDQNGDFVNITLSTSQPIRAWLHYDALNKHLNITLAPFNLKKPKNPLASVQQDLSPFLLEHMFIGFTSATGLLLQRFYVLAWSFRINGEAQDFNVSKISPLPLKKQSTQTQTQKNKHMGLAVGLSLGGGLVVVSLALGVGIFWFKKRKPKFADVLQGWEVEYGPHRFAYKDLYKATKGFKESQLLGKGGFGQVYKGILPKLGTPVAVKKVWHEYGRGMKEFVAEIATIGRLRHPNLVRLLGYCRRKGGELFLVYDYMPNSSLDGLLFNSKSSLILSWKQRVKIIIDVAKALAYLHEEWVEVIIHRDIKASNVLLDAELNAKLGDFGLARFSNNGKEVKTTHLAGTLGYIAPELARKGKATTATDVFAFGAFCLEVVCGRRPVELQGRQEAVILVEWVLDCWFKEELLNVVDPKLRTELDMEEMKLVLKIGLLCSHSVPSVRPRMSQVLKFLKRMEELPEDFECVLDIREDYSGRLGDASRSAYFSQIQYNTVVSPITDSIICSGC